MKSARALIHQPFAQHPAPAQTRQKIGASFDPNMLFLGHMGKLFPQVSSKRIGQLRQCLRGHHQAFDRHPFGIDDFMPIKDQ